jgi:ubiquinone/menaquinone biosynthesis C-methylase UbiE
VAGPGDTDAARYDPAIYLAFAARHRYGRLGVLTRTRGLLTRATGLDGDSRLLDAGCGPGLLTVRLAHPAGQAAGLDPDAGMLAEGRRGAEDNEVMNIRWVQGLAEDLPAVLGQGRGTLVAQRDDRWPRPSREIRLTDDNYGI